MNNQIKIKVYKENKEIPLPTYAKNGDACVDLIATSIKYDKDLDLYVIDTGLVIEIPEGYEGIIRPRSSNTKTNYYMPNSPGTIDSGYRGKIKVAYKSRNSSNILDAIEKIALYISRLFQFTKAYHIRFKFNREEFPYKVGDRVAQFTIKPVLKIDWEEVESIDELSKTDRSDGGFGSTGK